jgi:hypothetical protein
VHPSHRLDERRDRISLVSHPVDAKRHRVAAFRANFYLAALNFRSRFLNAMRSEPIFISPRSIFDRASSTRCVPRQFYLAALNFLIALPQRDENAMKDDRHSNAIFLTLMRALLTLDESRIKTAS